MNDRPDDTAAQREPTRGGDTKPIGEQVEDAVEQLMDDISPTEENDSTGRDEREPAVERDGSEALDAPDSFTA